ncbi:MAG: AAA family ATPase [Clostridia bacterium]
MITLFGPSNVGKTITIINIAKILENKYKKILIIDFDLNKPNINNFLGIKTIKNNFVKINNLENIKNNLNKLLIKYNKNRNNFRIKKLF